VYDVDGDIAPLVGVLIAGGVGGLIGGGIAELTGGSFYTGFLIGAISGLTGGTLLALEVPVALAGALSGALGSGLGVLEHGGNPFDGGRGTASVLVGTGLGAATAFLGTRLADALDLDILVDIMTGIAGGTAEGVYGAWQAIATSIQDTGSGIFQNRGGQISGE